MLTIRITKNLKQSLIIIVIATILLPITGLVTTGADISTRSQTVSVGEPINSWDTSTTELIPTHYADAIYDSKTISFIESTRNIPVNNATSLDQIYYRLATIKLLNPSLSLLPIEVQNFWVSQVLSFQRSTGGFGDWNNDRSSVATTHRALQVLDWLGYSSLNTTLVTEYLDRLQNSVTDGYNSYLLDTDSDVHSTYHAIASYQLIGSSPSNTTAVAEYFKRAQNPDGGFGQQTNNEKGIYWTSKVTVTQDAISGLNILIAEANDPGAALGFVQGLQLISSGGYVNDIAILDTSASYTSSALDTIYSLGGVPLNISLATDYLLSLEDSNGGFRLKPTSADRSLIGTYYAVQALEYLGALPTNTTATLNYVMNPTTEDGYGGTPGETPTLRETFDAVFAQVLMGINPTNPQGIIDFLESYRNPDGGFGLTTSFTESTLRVLETYDLLGIAFPNPSETINYLKGLQLPNGGFVKSSSDTTAYIVSTYRAIRALEILGSLPNDVSGAIAFIKGSQNGDGGFGGFLGDTSDVTNTYRGIRALHILGSSANNEPGVLSFILGSQNPDGGFRRSLLDTALPNNISNTIFTYSAIRALEILNSGPSNIKDLYSFITSVQNFDGGYAEHPAFTSNIAYTFVSLYVLRHFHEVSGFKIGVPDDANSIRFNYDSLSFTLEGAMGNLAYVVTNTNSSTIMNQGIRTSSGEVVIDTSNLLDGTYILEILASDPTGAEISSEITILISRSEIPTITTSETSTTTTDSQNTHTTPNTGIPIDDLLGNPLMLLFAIGGVGIIIVIVLMSRKRS